MTQLYNARRFAFHGKKSLRLMTVNLVLLCSYDNRQGMIICNGGKSPHTLLNANCNAHPIALRGHLTSQAGALPSKLVLLADFVSVHNASPTIFEHSSYATIAKQSMCDGYICNPCAIGATLELTNSISSLDYVQYKPPKLVATVDIIIVNATHRDILRYCTSEAAQEISEVYGSQFQIHSELCQTINVSYHGIMKGNIQGPNQKVLASSNEFMYEIDWHTCFPRGEHYPAWTVMLCIQVAVVHSPLSTAKEHVSKIDIIICFN